MVRFEGTSRFEQQKERIATHGAVLNRYGFLNDFKLEASKAKDHVLSAVMTMQPGESANQIMDVFRSAPKGTRKTLRYDAISELTFNGGIPFAPYAVIPGLRKGVWESRQKQHGLRQKLEELEVDLEVVNPAKGLKDRVFPFAGRTHLKFSAVDNRVAYVHTNNYSEGENTEIAVKFTGIHAEKLIEEFSGIFDKPPKEDYARQLTNDLWIYVDSGRPDKSLILDTAVKLVGEAKRGVKNCSLLAPDGKFAQALTQAHDARKAVEVVSTAFRLTQPLYSLNNLYYAISSLAALKGYPYPVYFDPFKMMHAKLLLPDQDKAFLGSHNLSSKGVKAGTVEVQILTTDPKIVAPLHARFQIYKELCPMSNKYKSALYSPDVSRAVSKYVPTIEEVHIPNISSR